MGHARCLLSLDDHDDMVEVGDQIESKKLSVRAAEALVAKIKNFEKIDDQPKEKIVVDPQVQHLENILKKNLGTQVKIKAKKDGGKIEISYYNNDELQRILDYMNVV